LGGLKKAQGFGLWQFGWKVWKAFSSNFRKKVGNLTKGGWLRIWAFSGRKVLYFQGPGYYWGSTPIGTDF